MFKGPGHFPDLIPTEHKKPEKFDYESDRVSPFGKKVQAIPNFIGRCSLT